MQKPNAFMNVVVRKFAGAARRLKRIEPPRPLERKVFKPAIHCSDCPEDHCANEPAGFFACGETKALWALGARVGLVLWLVASLTSQAAVREVGAIGLTVGDLDRTLEFYTKVLPFEKISESKTAPGMADDCLGLQGTELRSAELRLGDERVTLTEHLKNKGRPIPPDSRSFDHWFQHIAIVVSDMDRAYEHLRRHKVRHVSTGPQTLPAWNKDAGGIKAFYFRDPEDHVLEIIWFPPGKGDPKWQQLVRAGSESGAPLFLGIDHTAIVVSDTDRSLEFYRDWLGLKVAGGAENYGTEQEHLNQVFGARLRITALRAERGPGIEFLEYITPPGGRTLPAEARANDLVFWHTRLHTDDLNGLAAKLRKQGVKFVSAFPTAITADQAGDELSQFTKREMGSGRFLVRDPDGHALELGALRTTALLPR